MSISSGTMSVGVMAIFSGLLGAYGLRAVLLSEPTKKGPVEQPVVVPLASADLPAGRIVKFGDVAIHRLTRKQMAERKLLDPAVMLSPEQVMGRRTRKAIKMGEPFLTNTMYLEGDRPDITDLLKPGLRAVSLPMSEIRGGALEPGTTVDVVFRSRAEKPAGFKYELPETTFPLIEGVEVLWVEKPQRQSQAASDTMDITRRNVPPPPPSPPEVTLAVTLEQANMLRAVEGHGTLTLLPRSSEESPSALPATSTAKRYTLPSLIGVKPPAKPLSTEIYRAGNKQVRVFPTETEDAISFASDAVPDSSPNKAVDRTGGAGGVAQ